MLASRRPERLFLSTQFAMPKSTATILIPCLLLALTCSEERQDVPEDVRLAPITAPTRAYWPTTAWRTASPESQGIDPDFLARADEYAFQRTGNEEDRAGIRTDGVVIVRNGYIVYERYARDYTAETPHLTWSVSKSFVNALFGIASEQGLLDIDEPAAKYFPALDKPDRRSMTIRNILNMSSGISWSEGYEASPLKSSVIAMLYTRGRGDMANFTAGQSMRAQPGTYVYYSSGDSNLLMGILKNAVPAGSYDSYAWDHLFDVIGMKGVTWERDGSGTFVGSSYIYATHRDLARFGFLYLNDGNWDGRRLFPLGWVDFTRTAAPGYRETPAYPGIEEDNYTAHWVLQYRRSRGGYSASLARRAPRHFRGPGSLGTIPVCNTFNGSCDCQDGRRSGSFFRCEYVSEPGRRERHSMKLRVTMTILGIAGLLCGLWFAANFQHVRAFFEIISSYYAKEFCSCYYVVGRTEEQCHDYARQYVPISDFENDPETKTVTVTGLWHTNRAHYVDQRFGCALEPLD